MKPLGAPPPPDPARDAALRQGARAARRRSDVAVACALGQFLLAFALGAWALAAIDDPEGAWPLIGAVTLGFLLMAAHGVTQGTRLIAALVGLALAAPSLFRRRVPAPDEAPSRRTARDESVSWLSVALHTAVLLAAAETLALGLAVFSPKVEFLDLSGRVALAVFGLAPFTRRALEVLWPEG